MIPDSCNMDDNVPDSLFEQCVKYVVRHLNVWAASKNLYLKQALTLPSKINEKLLEVYQRSGYVVDDSIVYLFQNPDTPQLKGIKLRNSTITDDGLYALVNYQPLEIDLANCRNLTERSLEHINAKGDKLISLSIGIHVQIFDTLVPDWKTVSGFSVYERGYILNTPNLRKLTIKKLCVPDQKKMYFALLLKPLTKLTFLDLSECSDLGNLSYLANVPNLTTLILFNVSSLQNPNTLTAIKKLKNLRHLDISQLNENYGTYKNPNQTLAALVESLPNLMSLDISGTNLAGTGVADTTLQKGPKYVLTDIPGLRSRVEEPFEFLGLYKTHHKASKRHNIPAKHIAGDANIKQTITAIQAYLDRPDVLAIVLNDLYHLFRYEDCNNWHSVLSLLLEAMDRNLHEKTIQTSGSAVLYYIAKIVANKPDFKLKMKRHMITTLINGMSAFRHDETLIRNVCLTLCQFDVPFDLLFAYERLILLLLHIMSETEQGLIQRIGIFMLNSLTCHVDNAQKLLLGNLGTMDKLLALVSDRLQRKVCDSVLELAWSIMWNITDETIENCQRFLDEGGMDLFRTCRSMFPYKGEILRNMMGLLGNVAEMKSLRPFLMQDRFVIYFTDLLGSLCEGIEVSYNAAGVLVHLCSDDVEAWTVKQPSREFVLTKVVAAIESWNLTARRNINYRSFQPIYRLIKITHTEECRYWGVWALANLTTVYSEKYCPMVLDEGGLEILEEVVQTEHTYKAINELAKRVIKNCTIV